jgi:hypothetical protein
MTDQIANPVNSVTGPDSTIQENWLPKSFLENLILSVVSGGALALTFWITTWIFKISASASDMMLLVINLILASFTVMAVSRPMEESHKERTRMLAGLSSILALLLGYAFWAHRVIGFLEFPHDTERDIALEQFKKIGLSVWLPTVIGMIAFAIYFVFTSRKTAIAVNTSLINHGPKKNDEGGGEVIVTPTVKSPSNTVTKIPEEDNNPLGKIKPRRNDDDE